MAYIILAIFIFGILIAVHEWGHFLAARACGVHVLEFSVGMGPAVWKKTKNGTDYSLRLLPVGGFCAMEGEEEDSDSPAALNNKNVLQKLIIFAAGAGMNFLVGFIIILLLYANVQSFQTAEIAALSPEFENPGQQLQVGDKIWSLDGKRVYLSSDLSLLLTRLQPEQQVELVVKRNGQNVVLKDFPLRRDTYTNTEGTPYTGYGMQIYGQIEASGPVRLQYAWYNTLSFVRLVWLSLGDLVSGVVGLSDMQGPVGIVDTISQVGKQADSTTAALRDIFYIAALIAVNLAVMNLLPLPALDGGRIFFLLLNALTMLLVRRQIPVKYEGYIHMAGLVLLMGLMLLITFQDVLRIVR